MRSIKRMKYFKVIISVHRASRAIGRHVTSLLARK